VIADSSLPVRIRPIERRDEAAWRELWAGYQSFYEVALSEAVTAATWARFFDPASTIHGRVAEDTSGIAIGLCHYILHANTWEIAPVCYLEDLYVSPDQRASGIGEALIEHLRGQMKTEGWSRLYWLTREDNYRARGLYDRFTRRDAFVRYVLKA